jgi:hypothetical protein
MVLAKFETCGNTRILLPYRGNSPPSCRGMALNYFVSGKLKITDEQFARAPKYTTKSFLIFLLHGGVGKVKISSQRK